MIKKLLEINAEVVAPLTLKYGEEKALVIFAELEPILSQLSGINPAIRDDVANALVSTLISLGAEDFSAELKGEQSRLSEACDRLRDILADDDGQAWVEAKKFLRHIGEPESLAEKKAKERGES